MTDSSQEHNHSESQFPSENKQHKELIAELNTMTRLRSIATRFVQEADASSVLLEIIDAAISITNADKGNIQLFDEELGALKIVAARGFAQPFLDHFALCLMGKAACGVGLKSNKRVIVEDITQSPIFVGTPDLQPLLDEDVRAVQSTPLKSRSGKMLGMLSTHYRKTHIPEAQDLQMLDLLARLSADIMERGHWIQERATLIEKLREADLRKDNFLALLSHELRNPLASISNNIFLLSCVPAGSSSTKRIQGTINRQLKQITRLVDDLLDVMRISQNKIQLQRQYIDINELVCRTIEDNSSVFECLNISLQTHFADKPVMVNVDPIRIAQVVDNLLQNAAKFSISGGTTQISVFLEEKGQQAVIQVIDDGVGIEPDLIEHLFNPFMQADRTLDRCKGGLGLGLALVKNLVELHDGHVNVTSAGPKKGATFIIKLPLDNAIDDVIMKTDAEKITSTTPRSVLIIDDNIDVANSLLMVLETFGHIVYTSYSALEGIQKAQTIKPDFVLCDIGLPIIDGYQVAKILKANENLRSTYLIAFSGYASPKDIEMSHAAGFDWHLAKPANLTVLKQLLLQTKSEYIT